MGKKRTQKINRNSMFYSETDFRFEERIGLDYVSQDMNQSVLVFQIDRQKSKPLDIYGEVESEDDISYKEPVEIPVVLNLEGAKNKSYNKNQGTARYLLVGNLDFGVYEETLKMNNIDIKVGDYIGYQVTSDQMEYFVVVNDGRINFDNKHTMYGTEPFWRTVTCVPADKNEFKGI